MLTWPSPMQMMTIILTHASSIASLMLKRISDKFSLSQICKNVRISAYSPKILVTKASTLDERNQTPVSMHKGQN